VDKEVAMRTAIGVGGAASGGKGGFDQVVAFAVEAERLGVDQAWSAEAWGWDAVSTLAYLAARTERMHLGTGIMQISARAPANTAMTAMTMSAISGGRFHLGLGASGPQVVEGLHGVPFAHGVTRMRETVEIVRKAMEGEKLVHEGRFHQLPLPGGEGKPLRLALPADPDIPIHLATLSPAGLRLTGELADGWLGTSFIPEHAEAHLEHLRAGAAKAGRSLSDLDLAVGGPVAFCEDPEPLLRQFKPRVAFTLGAMGSPKTNFYNEAYRRAGFEDAAIEVQRLWVAHRRDEAAAAVPDELVEKTTLFGSEASVKERIRAYRSAGITTLRIDPVGESAAERLDTLGRTVELVREVSAE
jgi:F420-dependent oxidoreductase-like protein